MANDNEEPTAVAPPADLIDPLSPQPPRWRFVNEAKKSLGYSSIHAGSYVRGKSSDELGAKYVVPDISLYQVREERAKPKRVEFELTTKEPLSKLDAEVGKLDANVSPVNELPDERVEVGRLTIEEASRDERCLPSGDFAGLQKSATQLEEARKPFKEWDVRVQVRPNREREQEWYDGDIHDSYTVPGDDGPLKARGGVGRLTFRDPGWEEEEFVGEVPKGRGGRGGREGSESLDSEFDARKGALFVNSNGVANDNDTDDPTAPARAEPTKEAATKSARKWICLLILLLLPVVIILGLLVRKKRSAPAGDMESGLLPPNIVANRTSVPSSSPSVFSEPSSPSSVVLGDLSSPTTRPTSQERICSKERPFNLCIAVDMSGSVCNNGDGSDCLFCPGATLLSAIGLASECRDMSVSEDTCCTNFAKVKEFASIMVNLLGNFPADKSFSVVQFATSAQIVRTLSAADETVLTIDGLDYTGGLTNHESAIQTCQQTLPSFDDGKNFIMLITDGLSSVPEFDPEGAAEAAATEAKSDGSFIIPVFISPDNDLSALEFMSRLSSDGIVFDVSDFDTLSSLQDNLIDQVSCS